MAASKTQTPPPVSWSRAAAGLAGVGALTVVLVVGAGLGPSWTVALVAATGAGAAVRVARARTRVAVGALLLVAAAGLGWIELVNKVQYGTLALSGPPPLVRWCGAVYRTSGISATAPEVGGEPAYRPILRTPSGAVVFGVGLGPKRACGATLPLFVGVGPARYVLYSAWPPRPALQGAGSSPGPVPGSGRSRRPRVR